MLDTGLYPNTILKKESAETPTLKTEATVFSDVLICTANDTGALEFLPEILRLPFVSKSCLYPLKPLDEVAKQ